MLLYCVWHCVYTRARYRRCCLGSGYSQHCQVLCDLYKRNRITSLSTMACAANKADTSSIRSRLENLLVFQWSGDGGGVFSWENRSGYNMRLLSKSSSALMRSLAILIICFDAGMFGGALIPWTYAIATVSMRYFTLTELVPSVISRRRLWYSAKAIVNWSEVTCPGLLHFIRSNSGQHRISSTRFFIGINIKRLDDSFCLPQLICSCLFWQ